MKNAPSAWSRALVFGVIVALAGTLALRPSKRASYQNVATGRTRTVVGTQGGTAAQQQQQLGGGDGQALPPGAQKYQCAAGLNGGATDTGVDANSIKLGATVVESGPGASFLSGVRYGMLAVVNKVNRAGGICGRRLDLKLVDDGWDFQRGGDYLRNLMEQDKVFALSVVPSSEGLKNISDGGLLGRLDVPVVGSDGMLVNQYTDPLIWPVAASTISTMHVIAKAAYDAGARNFGLVYERTYHFGVEGAYAFNQAVKRLTGHDIAGYSNPLTHPACSQRFCGIAGGASSYNTEVQTFNSACVDSKSKCDSVTLLLEPATALAFLRTGFRATDQYGFKLSAPQPLFNRDFSVACGVACKNMQVWTGYYPPVGRYLARKPVSDYVNDLKLMSNSADYSNSFVEGGYIGMSLVVKALRDVGPYLTRQRLIAALNSMTFDSGLADPLMWRTGNHFANTTMRAFSVQYQGGFVGWQDQNLAVKDPWVGKDLGS